MNKILFGGAFDPVHKGHINMAEIASETFDADVIFIPAVLSVWKDQSAKFDDKVNMLELAIKGHERFSISLFEKENGKAKTYSIETVKYYVNKYPEDKFYLLIGQDQVNEFHRWVDSEEISKLVQIIYLERPRFASNSENIAKYHMIRLEGDVCEASSSDIRILQSLKGVDFAVLEYIGEHHLYFARELSMMLDEHRYNHSLRVAKLAYQIAISNKLEDPEKYYIAGLLHDCGKLFDEDTEILMMQNGFEEYCDLPEFSYHQFIGSFFAQMVFGVSDQEIIDAIEFHATGKANMNSVGKVVYAADKIEPGRNYDSSSYIEDCLNDYEMGFLTVLQANKDYLVEKHKDFNNRLTVECFNYYLKDHLS